VFLSIIALAMVLLTFLTVPMQFISALFKGIVSQDRYFFGMAIKLNQYMNFVLASMKILTNSKHPSSNPLQRL
jgi:hypothetical protein